MLRPPAIIVIYALTALVVASAPVDSNDCTSFMMNDSSDKIHPLCTNKNVRVHETTTTASAQAVLPTSPMVPLHGNDDNDDSDAKQHVINHDTATTGDEIKQDADQDADHSSDNSINHDIGNGMEHGVDHDMDHDSDYNLDTDTDNGLNHTTGHDSEDDDDDDDSDNDMNHDIDHNAKDGDIDHDTGDDNNDHSITDHDIHHHPFNGTSETDRDQQDDDDDDDHIPANTTISKNKSGLTVMLKDDKNFCIFLPSSPGNRDENNGKNDPSAISDSEKSARVFCTSKSSQHAVPGGKPMPKGFIKSAKFASDKSRQFVQVTGSIDRDAYALSPKDGGGQYDNHGAGSPPESQCMGYPYFVALVEPDINHFCIRCCQWYSDCHAGRSAYGCQRVVPDLPPDDL